MWSLKIILAATAATVCCVNAFTPSPIPEDFDITDLTPSAVPESFEPNDVLGTMLLVIQDLALNHAYTDSARQRIFRYLDSPGVAVGYSIPQGRILEARQLMWALYECTWALFSHQIVGGCDFGQPGQPLLGKVQYFATRGIDDASDGTVAEQEAAAIEQIANQRPSTSRISKRSTQEHSKQNRRIASRDNPSESANTDPITARIEPSGGHIGNYDVFLSMAIAIIDLDSRTPDRTQDVVARTYEDEESRVTIKYQPHPEARSPAKYAETVTGLVEVSKEILRMNRFYENSFVLLRGDDPFIDGSMKVN